jgi:hypothetical protein
MLAGIVGILQFFSIKDWKERRSIWNLLSWITIVTFPLTAVPDALKQHNVELWWFFLIFVGFIAIWVIIGVAYRKSVGKYFKEYDKFLIIFPVHFLVVGMIIFWLVQATDVIK